MAKGIVKIQGEKFVSLWRGKKSREKIARELNVSASSVTQWSRPGVWGVNILKFESWPKSVREAVAADASEVGVREVAKQLRETMSQGELIELANLILALTPPVPPPAPSPVPASPAERASGEPAPASRPGVEESTPREEGARTVDYPHKPPAVRPAKSHRVKGH